ncbi:hypothetical protein COT47_01135 [Candidatus Woesearchaeota archaeon CG08_land_8_20_14_0_20_43_7]|nr:MAG: hypothetical protein COT47_01135 [Candidatus Woesearchaeota archaeon CG08_land_8_20_14_0_20_43_7]
MYINYEFIWFLVAISTEILLAIITLSGHVQCVLWMGLFVGFSGFGIYSFSRGALLLFAVFLLIGHLWLLFGDLLTEARVMFFYT